MQWLRLLTEGGVGALHALRGSVLVWADRAGRIAGRNGVVGQPLRLHLEERVGPVRASTSLISDLQVVWVPRPYDDARSEATAAGPVGDRRRSASSGTSPPPRCQGGTLIPDLRRPSPARSRRSAPAPDLLDALAALR
jgi:hypothetical protein